MYNNLLRVTVLILHRFITEDSYTSLCKKNITFAYTCRLTG